jgi:hypothetical protein
MDSARDSLREDLRGEMMGVSSVEKMGPQKAQSWAG